jgi:hypothetical protein
VAGPRFFFGGGGIIITIKEKIQNTSSHYHILLSKYAEDNRYYLEKCPALYLFQLNSPCFLLTRYREDQYLKHMW